MLGLDRQQQAAVDAGPVDVCIGAGAGSGKTRVLTARFISAVLGIAPYVRTDPHRLLTVTFTDKAAGELAERIRLALIAEGRHEVARRTGDAWISTIHGMCTRILREYALDAGIDPGFRILDQVEAAVLESEALEHALGETMEQPAVQALLDMYGPAEVLTAARGIRSAARSLGIDITEVQTISSNETLAVLAEAGRSLRQIGQSLCDLPRSATVDACASAVEQVACVVEEACADPGPTSLESALCGLVTTSMTRRDISAEGYRSLAEEAHELVGLARACVAQLQARRLEEGFMALLVAFDRRHDVVKRARGALDFEDLQVVTARLLAARPDVAAALRARFAMVMVDEFQDTNELQLSIVERLSHGALCTVGDENQSIYAFRHADVGVFRRRLDRVRTHADLDVNYRIEPSLLAALNAMFAHPALLGEGYRPLRAGREPSPSVDARLQVRFVDRSECDIDATTAEAQAIAARVQDHLHEGAAPGEIAVLMARMAGGRAAAVERELRGRGIRAVLASGGTLFGCAEVAEVRALLGVIDNVRDDEAVVELLAGRLTGLSPDSMLAIRRSADERAAGDQHDRAHLWDPVAEGVPGLTPADAEALARTVEAVSSARRRRGAVALSELLSGALLDLDADLTYFALGADGVRAWANVLKIVRMARDYEAANGGGIRGFLEHLDAREQYGSGEREAALDGELDAVRVMSIHASKGLEFPRVVIGGLGSPRGPGSIAFARFDGTPLLGLRLRVGGTPVQSLGHARVGESVAEVERAESKRLLYVACTRAREHLTIVAAADPAKDATDDPAGWIRQAVGCGAAGSLSEREQPLAESRAELVLWRPAPAGQQTGSSDAAVLPAIGRSDGMAVPTGETGMPDGRQTRDAGDGVRPVGLHAAVRRVSYTGLALYTGCPYRFFLTSVLGLPQPDGAAADRRRAFGDAVHAVLERCTSVEGPAPGALDAALVAHRLGAEERPRLERAVASFLSSGHAREALAAASILREAPICVQIGGVTLVGSIDLLARDGTGAVVIDYKTGSGADGDDAHARYELQASCYALAVVASGVERVRVVFAELERGGTREYVFGADDRDVLEGRIGSIVAAMARGEFEPLSAYRQGLCDTCPGLGGMCPIRRHGSGAAG